MQSAKDNGRGGGWSGLEPYAQLAKALLPRSSALCLFDPQGELRWSSEHTTGPDLGALIDEALPAAQAEPESAGQLRLLAGRIPVYLCWVRDGAQLIAVAALVCRESAKPQGFGFVHALLTPVLECLRRDLVSRSRLLTLSDSVSARNRDVELLLSVADEQGASSRDSADELKSMLRNAARHLQCALASLLVPEKGIALMVASGTKPADGVVLARTHRQLLSMVQMRREPLIVNRVAPARGQAPLSVRILCCPLRHPSGRTMGVFALFRPDTGPEFVERDARLVDLIARKASQVIESSYDALSGLLTRPAFEQRVATAIADAAGGRVWSLLYIDADQLHVVNENHGMHVGDNVLAQLGELVRRRLPPRALAARISGDRFAVLLPADSQAAADFAESLREGAEQVGSLFGDARLRVSMSIGVAPYEPEAELAHVFAAAESACKAAKDRGRNRIEVYRDADASIVRRVDDIIVAGSLREAIAQGRLFLEGQLILPLGTERDSRPHFELLLRMIGSDGSTVGPDRFLSAATRYQLMPEIDRWVIRRVIELLQPYAELLAQRPLVFAVNFSGQSVSQEAFHEFLVHELETCGLDPAIFCFELTENAAVANIHRAEVLMRRLRKLGCALALDDFGVGLSSLSYLRQLPVTMLKIDGSFVRDILKDPRSESMVRAIAQLSQSMGLATVAEYVETDELLARVAALGVHYGQGFAIGRPTPLTELLAGLPVFAAAAPPGAARRAPLPLEPGLEQLVVGMH